MNFTYLTPFVGLNLLVPCYLKLISNFRNYINVELSFVSESKYVIANKHRFESKNFYPIGIIGCDIEIHFLHYQTQSEAKDKWDRRVRRINFDNLFFLFSERDLCEPRHIELSDRIDLPNKVCFTANAYNDFSSTVWIREYQARGEVGDIYTTSDLVYKYFDPVKWLNSEYFIR